MPRPTTLTTERLVLRPLGTGDLDLFAALCSDPDVRRYYPNRLTRQQSEQLAESLRRRFADLGWGLWAVDVRGSGFAGIAGLNRPTYKTPFTPCVEVGWQLMPRCWGCGYATEAGDIALRFAFMELKLDEVVSFTTFGNIRSQAVMRRLGMTRDYRDDFEHPQVPIGHPFRPHVLYRLPRARWTLLHNRS